MSIDVQVRFDTDINLTTCWERFALHGPTMGTRFSAQFYGLRNIDKDRLQRRLQIAVDRVDHQMSTWNPESDLMRLNAAKKNTWVTIPRELFFVLQHALMIGDASGGAFDIGVGDLVNRWGFGPLLNSSDTQRGHRRDARRYTDIADALELDPFGSRACKRAPLTLDLCGIAKGFGVDELARVLDEEGIKSYCVSIDGELCIRGLKDNNTAWTVAIENPDRYARSAICALGVTDCAIATSGDYRHFRRCDGLFVSHTMDPRLCQPVSHTLASVTVATTTCMEADAWATALLSQGQTEGVRMAIKHGLDALFIDRTDTGLTLTPTGVFVELLNSSSASTNHA